MLYLSNITSISLNDICIEMIEGEVNELIIIHLL